MKNVSVVTKDKVEKTAAGKAVSKKSVAKTVAVEKEVMKQEKEMTLISKPTTETSKKVEEEKVVPKMEEKKVVKKAPEKKEAVEMKEEVYVQFSNCEASIADVVDRAKAAYVAEGHTMDSIEQIRVYIKPAENMAYYVVNDEYASGISLC